MARRTALWMRFLTTGAARSRHKRCRGGARKTKPSVVAMDEAATASVEGQAGRWKKFNFTGQNAKLESSATRVQEFDAASKQKRAVLVAKTKEFKQLTEVADKVCLRRWRMRCLFPLADAAAGGQG